MLPYWLNFTLYLLVTDVVVLTLAHLLSEYSALVNVMLAVSASYLAILISRRVLKRERL
jgi:hypothetical protein